MSCLHRPWIPRPGAGPRPARVPRLLLAVAALLAMAPWPPATEAAPAPMVVAVLYFDNNTGDRKYDVLQKGLADMLVTDLASVPALQVVEREKLEQLIDELDLQRSKYFDPKTAQKLGRVIGARYAVTGAFTAIEPRMRIDIRLVDVERARVVMADKVIGAKDAFFELESALVAKFARGLAPRARARADSGVRDVATLLAYSEGIDLADKGDLENASRKLGTLVRSTPRFTLAQKRYTEILRRLRLAKKRREQGLGDDEKILLANIERELAKNLAGLDQDGAHRYFAYRVARGSHLLWQVRKLTGLSAREAGPAWVPPGSRKALRRHLVAFYANTETLLAEMRAFLKRRDKRNRAPGFDTALPDEDRRRGKELGISDDVGEWTFATPPRVARALAELTLLGVTPYWLELDRFTARPSLAEMDPRYAGKAIALLEAARRDILATKTGEDLQTAMAENIDTHAEGLLRLGRREEAIAQWQSFLDRFPKAPEYKEFEAKIEALLGITEQAQAFQAALASCSNELLGMIYQEVERVGRAEGSPGVQRLVRDMEKQCVRGPMGPAIATQAYFHAARDAVLSRGDCELYRDMEARTRKLGEVYLTPMKQLAQQPGMPCE